jgi:stage III sporulation protein AH
MKIRRNQIIVTALVVMIAVAGYLNYVDTKTGPKNQLLLDDQGEISALISSGEAESEDVYLDSSGDALILGDNSLEISDSYEEDEAGEAIFVNTSNESSYFVQAKLEREQSRSLQKETLMSLINNGSVAQEQKAVCADAMLEIQKRIEKETAAEAMIESKGFKEVYVRIDDATVDVVVNKEALTDAEIAQIEDIVKRKTGMNADQIRIVAMKKG